MAQMYKLSLARLTACILEPVSCLVVPRRLFKLFERLRRSRKTYKLVFYKGPE